MKSSRSAVVVTACVVVALFDSPAASAEGPLAGTCRCTPAGEGSVCDEDGDPCSRSGKSGKCDTRSADGPGIPPTYCICDVPGVNAESSTGIASIEPRPPRSCTSGEYVIAIDTARPRSVLATVPARHGGGLIQLVDYDGAVTVAVSADGDTCRLRTVSGSFTAPSARLPDGAATGPNQLDVGGESAGVVDVDTGSFELNTRGTLRNRLYPDGVAVSSRYSGTIDFETGAVAFQTLSFDEFPPAKIPKPRSSCGGCTNSSSTELFGVTLVALASLAQRRARRLLGPHRR